jgi:hypothetical protein
VQGQSAVAISSDGMTDMTLPPAANALSAATRSRAAAAAYHRHAHLCECLARFPRALVSNCASVRAAEDADLKTMAARAVRRSQIRNSHGDFLAR